MNRKLAAALVFLSALASSTVFAENIGTFKTEKVTLPDSSTMFASGPDSDAINNNCLACHSAEMVLFQPSLPRETWQAEVDKMRNAYKAPIDDKDAAAIVEYLMRTKGTK